MHGVDGGVGAMALGLGGEPVDEEARQQSPQGDDQGQGPGPGEPRGAHAAAFGHGVRSVEGGQQMEKETGGQLESLEEDDGGQAGDHADQRTQQRPLAQVGGGGDGVAGSSSAVPATEPEGGSQLPAALPAVLGNLTGGGAEAREGPHQSAVLGRIDGLQDAPDLLATSLGDTVDQAPARGAQVQQHHSAIDDVAPAGDEALAHQSVAHAGGGRGIHAEGLGQIDGSLRTPGPEDHERPVLRQGDLCLVFGQGSGGHGHENPAGGEDGIG